MEKIVLLISSLILACSELDSGFHSLRNYNQDKKGHSSVSVTDVSNGQTIGFQGLSGHGPSHGTQDVKMYLACNWNGQGIQFACNGELSHDEGLSLQDMQWIMVVDANETTIAKNLYELNYIFYGNSVSLMVTLLESNLAWHLKVIVQDQNEITWNKLLSKEEIERIITEKSESIISLGSNAPQNSNLRPDGQGARIGAGKELPFVYLQYEPLEIEAGTEFSLSAYSQAYLEWEALQQECAVQKPEPDPKCLAPAPAEQPEEIPILITQDEAALVKVDINGIHLGEKYRLILKGSSLDSCRLLDMFHDGLASEYELATITMTWTEETCTTPPK